MPDRAEHLGECSSNAVAHLMAKETEPDVKLEVQDSKEEAILNWLQEEAVSNTMSSNTTEKRLCNSSKVTQTPDILKSNLDSLQTRPMIIGPEIYSGYAEVLYAGGSRSSDIAEMRNVSGFQNSLIVKQINDNGKDNVESVHTSASTNKLLDEMKSVDVIRNFEISPPVQICRTDSSDVKPVHVALAQTHLASRSDGDTSGNECPREESFNVEKMIIDSSADLTSRNEQSDSALRNNFMDQQRNKKSEIQNKLVDSSVSGPTFVDSTFHSANGEPDCTHTSLVRNVDTSGFKLHTLRPIRNEITVESSNETAVMEALRIAPRQPIETPTPGVEIGCVDSSCAPPPAVNHFPHVEADHVSSCNVNLERATRDADLEADMLSLNAGSEAETVDVETMFDETATVAWSSAETRGSLESMALEDMDVDVDGEDAGEGAGEGAAVEVPDEWCDACRQRFSPATDIASLSRRYRVAKWLSSLLGFVGLVSCDDPDRVPMDMLGPPAMAPPSRSRGFFF